MQSQLRTLHREVEQAALHQPLADSLAINLDSLSVGYERSVEISHPFQRVSLAKEAKAVVGLGADDCSEVSQGFFKLLLIDVDLAAGNVSFDVAWMPLERLAQRPQRPNIIVDAPVRDREHDIDGFAVVGANFDELVQIDDRLLGLARVKQSDRPIKQRIKVQLIRSQTFGEHLHGLLVVLVSEEDLARFKMFVRFDHLWLRHSSYLGDLARGD